MPPDVQECRIDSAAILGQLGEIRGTLATFMAEHARSTQEIREDLKNRLKEEAERWARMEERIAILIAWKNQVAGGMKFADIFCRVWAAATTLILAVLGYVRVHG